MIKASGNTVEAYWPGLFAKALKGKNIDDLLSNMAAAAPAAAPAGGATEAAPAEEKKEEKEEEEEEADLDMDDLFG